MPGAPHRAAARGRGRDGQDPAGRRGRLRRGGDRRPGAGRPLLHGGAIALPPAVRRRPHPGAGRVAAPRTCGCWRAAGARRSPDCCPDSRTTSAARSGDRGSPEAERRRAFEAVLHVLTGLAAQRPLLLVLDDLHNTGQASVELVHYVARHAGAARLLVVATVRAEEGADALRALAEVAGRCDVGPLPAAAVAELVAAAGREELADAILARTRGHTLFVVETLRGLAAGQAGMPETLQAAVLSRLGRAGPELEELLRAGAVLGPSVSPDVVAGLLGVPPHEAARRCERAAATRLLVPAGRTYEFANDLVQEVLYATTPAPTRAVHHRRAADLLVAQPEAVGRHAAAVEDWPRAARAWLLAGERTRRRSAADAVALLDRALDAARRGDEPELVGRVLIARGRAREALERYADALDDHRTALAAAREAGDRRLEMVALARAGRGRGGRRGNSGGGVRPAAALLPADRGRSRGPGSRGGRAGPPRGARHASAVVRGGVRPRTPRRRGRSRRGRRRRAGRRPRRPQDRLRLPRRGRRAARRRRGAGAARPADRRPLPPALGAVRGRAGGGRGGRLGHGAGRHRGGPRREPA